MKAKALLFVLALVCCSLMLAWGVHAGSLESFDGEKGSLKIAGGTAHIPVMKEAAKRIMTHNPEIQISIAGGGSGVGIKQVGEGLIDIGNSGRKAKDEEITRYGLKMYKWAIDGVGIAVDPRTPEVSLSKTQAKEVFAGNIMNWKELGGEDKTINVYTRDEASGTRAVFWKKALGKGDITSKANFVVSNGAMKSAVAQDPIASVTCLWGTWITQWRLWRSTGWLRPWIT